MIASARGEKDWRPLRWAAGEEVLVAARVERRRRPAAWLAGNPAMRRSTSTIDGMLSDDEKEVFCFVAGGGGNEEGCGWDTGRVR